MGVSSNVYIRMIGNSIGLALHTVNVLVILFTMQGDILKDPDIRTLKANQMKFLTIWNMSFQMIFLFLSILCDVQLFINKNSISKYVNHIRGYNDILFSAIVCPLTIIVFVMFWSIFSINRELIFPVFIDKAISLTSNHILHTAILPIVLLELFFHPRSRPTSHKLNLAHVVFVYVSYLFVTLHNYATNGTWLYPFLGMMYGTIYFPLLLLVLGVSYLGLYYVQWTINDSIHGHNKSKTR